MDKVILITGASSGIGEGIARELGAAGGKILLGARRQARIEAIATEIRDAGGTALAQVLDVTDRHSMASLCAGRGRHLGTHRRPGEQCRRHATLAACRS